MEDKFLQNLDKQLLNNNFYKLNTNLDNNIYFKTIGTNGYLVVPVLKDEEYEEIFNKVEAYANNILSQNNLAKMFVVKILAGKSFDEEDNSFFDKDIFLDEKIVNINWGVDLLSKKMISKGKQPNKFLHIEKYIKNSLKIKEQVNLNRRNYVLSENCNITYNLMFIIAVVHIIVTMEFHRSDIIYSFGVSPSLFADRQEYRLFTFLFLHSGLTHLLSNLLSLYIFGTRIEKYLGKTAFLLIFFIGGFASGIFSVMFTKSYSIGASGAIFALESATLYFSIKEKVKLDGLDYYTIGIMSVIGIIGSFADASIDNAGHIGGFLMGFIVCFIYYHLVYKRLINRKN